MTTTLERQRNRCDPTYQFRGLKFFLLVVLLLGIFFRFLNLGQKIYWIDETFTSLRISGYTKAELVAELNKNQVFSSQDLHKYQYANGEKTVIGTIKGLATEEPQHPPLYFALAHGWGKLFTGSTIATRTFPALISLLVFPALYWLCQELFTLPIVGWAAMALVAVSPFHILYAQESRQYGLWTVIVLFSSAALLRAIRRQTFFSWGVYSTTVALGIYTFFFSSLVTIGHGIYVAIGKGIPRIKSILAYFLATLGGIIIFLPWLYVSRTNLEKVSGTTNWANEVVTRADLAKTWLLNLSRLLIDFNGNMDGKSFFVYCLAAILVGYALYFLCYHTSPSTSIFILTLIFTTVVILVIPDFLGGGKRSSVARYFIPSYLGIHLALAYLFATKLALPSLRVWQQQLWRIILIVVLSGGIISSIASSQTEFWWNKYTAANLPQIAEIVNQSAKPLILTKSLEIMPLSYLLKPQAGIYWLTNREVETNQGEITKQLTLPENLADFSDVFYFNSSKKLRDLVEANYGYSSVLVEKWETQIEPVYRVNNWLWKLEI